MSTLGVITNPTSGSGRGARWGAEALTLLATGGHQVQDLSRGSWAASLAEARRRHRDLDALVVVGGDGMVHLGIQAVAGTRLPLGIVAAGSGNDVATSVGLPVHDIAASVAAIESGLRGEVGRIDLGRVDGPGVADAHGRRYFAAVLSAGLDAAVSSYANRLRFPRGPSKYKVATARELPRFKPYGVRIEVDGERWEQRCTLVAIANGPVFGGGLRISPDSRIADGRLELVLAEPMSALAVARIFPRLTDGSHLSDPRCRVVSGRRIRLSPSEHGAPLPAAFADGELVGPAPLDVRVEHGALSVLGVTADSLEA